MQLSIQLTTILLNRLSDNVGLSGVPLIRLFTIYTAVEKCMDEIEKWMVGNKLHMNGEKTDFVITGSASLLRRLNISKLKVGYSSFDKPRGKNLGVIFDSHLSMEKQVSALCKSCGHQIHMIGKIVKNFFSIEPHDSSHISRNMTTSHLS